MAPLSRTSFKAVLARPSLTRVGKSQVVVKWACTRHAERNNQIVTREDCPANRQVDPSTGGQVLGCGLERWKTRSSVRKQECIVRIKAIKLVVKIIVRKTASTLLWSRTICGHSASLSFGCFVNFFPVGFIKSFTSEAKEFATDFNQPAILSGVFNG